MDEIEPELADSFAATLRDPRLKLHSLEGVVRSIHQIERMNEVRRTLASYGTPDRSMTSRIMGAHPSLGARYSGKSAHTIIIDEVATFK